VAFILRKFLPLFLLVASANSLALPVDWHGVFGVDSTMISNYRRVKAKTANVVTDGSQEVALANGNKASSSFQSYVLKLAPEVYVNDAATLKLSMTTNYASGGFLGDSTQTNKKGNSGSQLYYHNQSALTGLNITKAYLELNSDTATYHIGRHGYSWGLGAIYNQDEKDWERLGTSRDGLTMNFKFSNFYVTPYWAKISNNDSGVSAGHTRATNAEEYGAGFLYDNKEKDIAFGLHYAKKSSNAFNGFYKSDIGSSTTTLGTADVKITDIYFKKIFGDLQFELEVPLISGEIGHAVNSTDNTSYNAKAFLFKSEYKLNDSWKMGLDAGNVSGHDGSGSKFGALLLHPNFQVANLLFKYNMAAYGDTTQSIYDSYLTNAQFLKLNATYLTEKWTLDTAFIYAQASEVAKAGAQAYNHTKNKLFNATQNQEKDLGMEIDFSATYKWNKEITIGSSLGYLMTGDYFAYTNSATKNETENSLLLQINTSINF